MNILSESLQEYRSMEKRKLLLSLLITTAVMVLEFVGGIVFGSIALLSDGGHMFTHSFAIGIGLVGILIARKPPCHHRTFGLYRAEILAAFINGLFLLFIASLIIKESIRRIVNPGEVKALQMLLVAAIGLAVNITSILILRGSHEHDLNIKGVFYHMIADTASSVGIIIGAVVIYFTDWFIIDPIISVMISVVILYWSWGILRESGKIFMEMAPAGLNVDKISDNLVIQFKELEQVHHMHVWAITPDKVVLTAHLKLHESDYIKNSHNDLIKHINLYLNEHYNIFETTMQITNTTNDICRFTR
jgi:cobalt-zinc-cadmium efflux system protein